MTTAFNRDDYTFVSIDNLPNGRRGRVAIDYPIDDWVDLIPEGMSLTFEQLGLDSKSAQTINKRVKEFGLVVKTHRPDGIDGVVHATLTHPIAA